MERREAKLRGDWLARMQRKEAQLRATWERLERRRLELAPPSAESNGVTLSSVRCTARSRAERSAPSTVQSAQSVQKTVSLHDARTSCDATPRSTSTKIPSFSRSASSSISRSPISHVPRPSYSNQVKRRVQVETNSVHNVSDLRKENRVPSSSLLARSKSSSEQVSSLKPKKPARSHSRRNSLASSSEFECVVPAAARSPPKQQDEETVLVEIQKSGSSKLFLRRGSGIGPGAGASIAKLRAFQVSEIQTDGDSELVTVGISEELLKSVEELKALEFSADFDEVSLNSIDPRSHNHGTYVPINEENDRSITSHSKFDSTEKVRGSSGESSGSWYSNVDSSLSNGSGRDESVDSPSVSSRYADSQLLARNKSETTEKPVLVSNTCGESQKDVAKGLRRFLNLGRKSKGRESTISATNSSVGDEDKEHVHELLNFSSNDLKKHIVRCSTPALNGLSEKDLFISKQDHALCNSMPISAVNLALQEDHPSGKSPKGKTANLQLISVSISE
ncbi:hypothetical protein ACMD2_20847 [Ananas comosus]|uniref:Uncharacterized protein n=1 Tax=Ananas comosus TaxID=4615 RepID=A0A199W418_ANACO|nr:hypothetical protein ACMD2_20847 [Ananas comosus]